MRVALLTEDERARIAERLAMLALAHIVRIRHTPEYRAEVRRRILESFHEKQRGVWEALQQGLRYIAACCSRRSGKTFFLASLIILLMLDAKFGQEVVFVAPTLKRGKELIWRELARMVDKYHLGWKLTENQGTISTPQGAYFRIVGLDNKKQIGKVSRGGNTLAFLADEVQEYFHLLPELLVGAGPALAQSRGAFIASGTPGVAEQGFWHEIAVEGKHGFVARHWTLLENPFLGRDPEEIIAEEMARNGWDESHPTLLREYRGVWVTDSTQLVVEFLRSRDTTLTVPHVEKDRVLPEYDVKTWRHWIGVDYGFTDPSAWVVLAAPPNEKIVYVVHCEQESGLTDDAIAETTRRLVEAYKPRGAVGDSASGGATFIATWNQKYGSRYNVRMRHAKKHDKAGSIKLLNTELRTQRLKLHLPAAEQLAQDCLRLQWKDADRTEIMEGPAFPDHLFDALRYALNDCNAILAKGLPTEPTEEEKELAIIIARNKQAALRI